MAAVLRSAYRQMLRVGAKLSKQYPDPNDFCFALFGVLVDRRDFAAAGYGDSFQSVVKRAFQRPSITGMAQDALPARLAASFGFLRRLHELEETSKSVKPRDRHRQVLGLSAAEAVPADATASGSSTSRTSASEPSEAEAEPSPPTSAPTPSTAAEQTTSSTLAQLDDAATASASPSDAIITGEASFFIERFQHRKVHKFSRHVVLSKDQDQFPPYPYLLPPEPVYPRSMRVDTPFAFMVDAVLCLSAAAQQYTVGAATSQEEDAARAMGSSRSGVVRTRTTELAAPLTPLSTPATAEEWKARLDNIPTRTIAVTDFMEVELCTQFVCSSTSPSAGRLADSGIAADTTLPGAKTAAKDMNLFLYYMFIRNRGPSMNPKKWHAQIMSQHLVIYDVARAGVVELARPGAMGNFPLLEPGSSHSFQSGASLLGAEGILRGTIQVNVFNEAGEMRCIDIRIAPTRLSVRAKDNPFEDAGEKKRAARRRRSAAVERRSEK